MNQQANYTNNAIKSENQGCLHTKRFRRRPYWFCVPSGTYNRFAPVLDETPATFSPCIQSSDNIIYEYALWV